MSVVPECLGGNPKRHCAALGCLNYNCLLGLARRPTDLCRDAVSGGSCCRRDRLHISTTETYQYASPCCVCCCSRLDGGEFFEERTVLKYLALGLPVVLINNNITRAGVDRVLIGNVCSARRSVFYLFERGHRRIACMH